MLDQITLRELMHYDSETGVFTWLKPTGRRVAKGSEAGCISGKGYRVIRIHGVQYNASNLAWLYMTGAWPTGEVDHKNRCRGDNRWGNLRDVSRQKNAENKDCTPGSSGWLGVQQVPSGKFQAVVSYAGTRHYVGSFDTPQAAHTAFIEKRKELRAGGPSV